LNNSNNDFLEDVEKIKDAFNEINGLVQGMVDLLEIAEKNIDKDKKV
jgi:hypothetical protein